MSRYSVLASFYDRLMRDTGYEERADYLLSLMSAHGCPHPDMLLDLACGSGNLTVPLAERGIDMIGVDYSEDMLAEARQKPVNSDRPILYLQQDMRRLDLYGTVDAAVCCMDGLNHILRTADLQEIFRRLRLFIRPDGLLLFDVNTPYKHREVLGNNAFVFEEEDFLCVWQNRYLPKTGEVDMQLDFFVDNGEAYDRYTDDVRERAYSLTTWKKLLAATGFELLGAYSDMTTDAATDTDERWVLVASNRKG